jgi:hydrophobic/amphiphilic exporter-1 (mainly G- bacteria), HAE1 family
VVFGGMIASTLLAIPFVPVFYVLVHRVSERFSTAPATAKAVPAPSTTPAP